MIFNIQRFSTHDGHGIRTIIFFKGCPLRCTWCSNPESQAFGIDMFFDQRKCIACQECVDISQNGEFILIDGTMQIQRGKIEKPLKFKDICPTKAITVVGEEQAVQEILVEVHKDLPFYRNSSGGVTLSGGEPFAQPAFLKQLLDELKDLEIHVAVETCLHVPWKSIENNIDTINTFLIDVKHTDAEKFRKYTGGDLDLILSNLKKLEARNADVIIRIPVLPGFNHTDIEMQALLDLSASLKNVHEVHFIPYHGLGSHKYALLGKTYNLSTTSLHEEELHPYLEYARQKGLMVTIGG